MPGLPQNSCLYCFPYVIFHIGCNPSGLTLACISSSSLVAFRVSVLDTSSRRVALPNPLNVGSDAPSSHFCYLVCLFKVSLRDLFQVPARRFGAPLRFLPGPGFHLVSRGSCHGGVRVPSLGGRSGFNALPRRATCHFFRNRGESGGVTRPVPREENSFWAVDS